MRDLVLILMLAVFLPVALRFPVVGLYLWEWLALMNPHRLAYGFARELPLNMVVAVLTVGAGVVASGAIKLRLNGFTLLLAVFSIWITVTSLLAPVPEATMPLWNRNIKTMLLCLMIVTMVTNRVRLTALLWIIAISIGFFGVKGGGFMLLRGTGNIIFGPPDSMIDDNNTLALALVMILPLLNYLRTQAENRTIRMALVGTLGLVFLAVIGSYSRGGFVALLAMLGFLWTKTRAKAVIAAFAVVSLSIILLVMPAKYFDRINSIGSAMSDASFVGRLAAWEVAWRTALDRPFGAGFDGPRQGEIWNRYLPEARARASHSIYFMVLGEHGFVGLALFLAICATAWRNLRYVAIKTRDGPALAWARDLAIALQVCLVGFFVGGAALPVAYYDGFWSLLAVSVVLRGLVEAELRDRAPALAGSPVPRTARLGHV